MLRNIFKTTFRSFSKNKTVSFINVIGLGVGLATCILMLLFIWDESNYDKHHAHGESLYRLAVTFSEGKSASGPAPMAEAFKTEFPEILQSARLLKYPMLESMLLTYEANGSTEIFNEPHGYYVDATFFDVLTYKFVEGNSKKVLTEPNTMVLSATLANKIFGERNPVGEIIQVGLPEGNFEYTVTGVFEDADLHSHVNGRYFLSISNSDIGEYVKGETS